MTDHQATKVLVIEDDADVLETLGRILERAGYQTVLAKNGREGMIMFATQDPALVITDILMPEREGIETIIEMRRARPDAKILAISGGGSWRNMEYLEMAEKLGATAVMPKPLMPDAFVQTVARMLSLCAPSLRAPETAS
jgi:DNA-binding NtrC family response regulator